MLTVYTLWWATLWCGAAGFLLATSTCNIVVEERVSTLVLCCVSASVFCVPPCEISGTARLGRCWEVVGICVAVNPSRFTRDPQWQPSCSLLNSTVRDASYSVGVERDNCSGLDGWHYKWQLGSDYVVGEKGRSRSYLRRAPIPFGTSGFGAGLGIQYITTILYLTFLLKYRFTCVFALRKYPTRPNKQAFLGW